MCLIKQEKCTYWFFKTITTERLDKFVSGMNYEVLRSRIKIEYLNKGLSLAALGAGYLE